MLILFVKRSFVDVSMACHDDSRLLQHGLGVHDAMPDSIKAVERLGLFVASFFDITVVLQVEVIAFRREEAIDVRMGRAHLNNKRSDFRNLIPALS